VCLCVQRLVIKTKSVEFMPFLLSLSVFLCGTSWFIYGLLGRDPFIIVRLSLSDSDLSSCPLPFRHTGRQISTLMTRRSYPLPAVRAGRRWVLGTHSLPRLAVAVEAERRWPAQYRDYRPMSMRRFPFRCPPQPEPGAHACFAERCTVMGTGSSLQPPAVWPVASGHHTHRKACAGTVRASRSNATLSPPTGTVRRPCLCTDRIGPSIEQQRRALSCRDSEQQRINVQCSHSVETNTMRLVTDRRD
jgi:hypothetical protein